MQPPLLSPSDVSALRDYVKSNETTMCMADSTVILDVSHASLKARFPELRFDRHMTVESVKRKLTTMCGTALESMQLELRDERGMTVAALTDDSKKLGFYSPHCGWCLHITDLDPSSLARTGWLEDVSQVEKYVMTDEDYARRDNTYRKYKEQKLKEDPDWTLEKEICMRTGRPYIAPVKKVTDNEYMEEVASSIPVGARCCVDPGERRGVVRFVGRVEGLAAGYWVGVQYDEPLGKNDGRIQGRRYFECAQNYGAFVRPDKVQVGDFPPVDDLSDLSSSDEL